MTATSATELRDALASCCSPLTGGVLSEDQATTLASVLKAIADPNRLRLISLIAAQDGGEACVCDLTAPVNLSQPTVSHHLKLMVDASVLDREQRGKWAYYRITPDTLNAIARLIDPT